LVVATVTNTGGRALDMVGSLELRDGPGGLNAGPFPAKLGSTLAVGTSGQVLIELDKAVPAGPWDAKLTLRSGLLERSAKASITFPGSGSARPAPATPTGAQWPLICLASLVLLLLCAGLAVVVRRRYGADRAEFKAAE